MTKQRNMTRVERQAVIEKDVQQVKMAAQVSQMLLQQVGRSMATIQKDIGELAARQRDLQYRTLAIQELNNVSLDVVNKKAEELQIRDFDDFSNKEDEQNGYTVTDTVEEDSVIIFTTSAPDSRGYLRSKQALSEIAFPDIKEGLLGKKVSDKMEADINGVTHTLTLLGIRKKPEEVSDEQQEDGQAMSAQA